ncbi:hypothetical protein HWV62_26146 [Athelia sp. TMB]|nr:hypothetical protein HWV62_26146 [Athelia sp. TMB]
MRKIAQNQKEQDDDVLSLVESLREMAGVASVYTEPREISGTVNVVEEIGKASLEAAILVHDYVDPAIGGKASFLESAIHAWLQAPDTSPSYNAARKKHQLGTGSWFLNGFRFSEWKRRPGSLLWLYGGPGTGKTILCSSAIQDIVEFCKSRPVARGYAYVFFDGTASQSETLDYNKFIRSLIKQMSNRCGDRMPAALVELYQECDDGQLQPLETALESTLSRILETFDSTYIIIDSLDESTEKADLLRWIRSVNTKAAAKIHLMLTSRPEPEVEQGLKYLSNLQKVSIRDQSTIDDISTYLDARLCMAEMEKWDEPEKQMIKQVMLAGSGGMFRWVVLQMDAVRRCNSARDLNIQLVSLPKGLDETYARIFERSERSDHLQILLQWLVFSERPMTVQTLAEALAFGFTGDTPMYNPDLRYKRPADILGICYGLVTEFEGTVKLAHYSVKEYFIKNIASERLSHLMIAQTCIAQLLYFDRPSILDWENPDSATVLHIDSSFPLALYAASNWASHYRSSGADFIDSSARVLHNLLLRLFTLPSETRSYQLIGWARLYNLDYEGNGRLKTGRLPLDASPLYYACRVRSIRAVNYLIDNGADVNAAGKKATSRPLLAACLEGQLEIAQLLLEKGANVNAEGGKYGTPLQAALARGRIEVAKLLLENGADVNAEGRKYGTALQAASSRGHLELARLLLSKGANVNAEGGEYGTALRAASLGGHLQLAQLLLEKGANVNAGGGKYGTPLQGAFIGGHLEVMKLLLNEGANVNVKGRKYHTLLEAASAQGKLEIAKLLLEKAADVNAAGGTYKTPLQAASTEGHLEIVKLLLDNGASSIAQGDEHGKALQAALAQDHIEVAQLLWERGAVESR